MQNGARAISGGTFDSMGLSRNENELPREAETITFNSACYHAGCKPVMSCNTLHHYYALYPLQTRSDQFKSSSCHWVSLFSWIWNLGISHRHPRSCETWQSGDGLAEGQRFEESARPSAATDRIRGTGDARPIGRSVHVRRLGVVAGCHLQHGRVSLWPVRRGSRCVSRCRRSLHSKRAASINTTSLFGVCWLIPTFVPFLVSARLRAGCSRRRLYRD